MFKWPRSGGRRLRPRIGRCTATITAASALLLATSAAAATPSPGSLDTTFGQGGSATVSVGSLAAACAVAVQPDGKIVTAGQATVDGRNVLLSIRMTPTGSLDPSYGVGGIVTVSINGSAGVDSGAALVLQPDGKIVIGGAARTSVGGPMGFAAVRLNSDGSFDPAFGHGGVTTVAIGPAAIANAVALQPDGKVVLAGTALVGHNEFAAVRLNANGTLDTTFGSGGTTTLSPTGGAWGLVVQSDGKLVLAGQADYANPAVAKAQQFMAARLNADGSIDPSFGHGGIVSIPIGATALGFDVAEQPDGKLVLAGPAFTSAGVAATVRLNTDGSLDQSYGTTGVATFPDWYGVNGITLDAAGRIVLPATGLSAVRLNPDGRADTSFGDAGNSIVKLGSAAGANGAAIQPGDGKIVLAGAATIAGQTVVVVTRLSGQSAAPSSSGGAAELPASTPTTPPASTPTTLPASTPTTLPATPLAIAAVPELTSQRCKAAAATKHRRRPERARARTARRRTRPAPRRRPLHHRSTRPSGGIC
jgi:uncharacterized delta-60 repeat protein